MMRTMDWSRRAVGRGACSATATTLIPAGQAARETVG